MVKGFLTKEKQSPNYSLLAHTAMCHLTMGYILRNASVSCCANITKYTYTNLDGVAYYTPRLYGIVYCSWAINRNSRLLYYLLQAIVMSCATIALGDRDFSAVL